YFRYNDAKTVMVILNGNSQAENLDTQRFAERMKEFTSGYDIISEKKINDLSVINVPAKTSMIIELSKN
ncbi:MAG: cyclomaltodextrinase C-terminal domain-containing protein, partial [Bacteroidota bacterium]|nr:cyclomaltodextrinase C-terminal domain-containing protein [Bacteroidota bacterium]